MSESEFQVVKSVGFVFAMLCALAIQRWRPHRVLAGSWLANGGMWLVGAAILGLVCAGCASTVSHWADVQGIGLLNLAAAPLWVAIPLSVLGLDLVSYFWHRANHRVGFLWRFHQAHHSDPDYTVTTALRFHPGELLLALPVRLTAVVLLGVPIVGVIVFELVFAFANFFEHGNIDLPRRVERALGRFVITPALHRRHHSVVQRELDSNFGTIFSFWDRSFRSYGDNTSDVQVETGLPDLTGPLGLGRVLALPVRGVFHGRGARD